MPKIEQQATVAGTREDGSTILLPEVEVVVKNLRTEIEYDDDDAADADVKNPETDTVAEEISRSVTIRVLKGVDGAGASGN